MHSKIIKPESNGREYPCMVVNDTVGDGEKPTVYLKPNKFISVVVVPGYMHHGLPIGSMFDARDEQTQKDWDVDEDGGIHAELPLFHGQVVIENGGA